MAKYGIIDKNTGKVVSTYEYYRMQSINLEPEQIQFELLESNGEHGLDEKAYFWDGSSIVFDINYTKFNPIAKNLKIYRFITNAKDNYRLHDVPKGHDYKRGLSTTLFPKHTFNKGELNKTEYFSDEAMTDLIIKVNMTYTRDIMGFATERTTTRIWIREDDTEHPDAKITKKVYGQGTLAPIEEGIRRRGNIVKGLQMPVLGMLLNTLPAKDGESEQERQERCIMLGRRFLAHYKEDFTMFIEDSNRKIYKEMVECTDFWMDTVIDQNGTTIRAYVLNELNIGGLM